MDSALFHSQYTKYRAAVAGPGSAAVPGDWHNVSLTLDTSEVRGFQFWARVQLGWPQLVARRRLRFGVTQVGSGVGEFRGFRVGVEGSRLSGL